METDDPVEIYVQTVPTGVKLIFADTNSNLDIDGTDDHRVDAEVAVAGGNGQPRDEVTC